MCYVSDSDGPRLYVCPLTGLILRPKPLTQQVTIDIYVDADFAGGWGYEDPQDPACVKSRTGYMIEVMGCPVIWVSKLQTEIATSTMEAEYSALSMAMHAAIPLLQIVRHTLQGFNIGNLALTQFKTTVHEDNQSCLKLALYCPPVK